MAIAMVGFMGAGKSTVGSLLAEQLHFAFLDIDSAIEESLALPITGIFTHYGEDYFRDQEARAIHKHATVADTVIAIGAGALENANTRSLLKDLPVVYLRVPLRTSLERIAPFDTRPLSTRADIGDIYRRRAALYQEVATVTVDTVGRDPAAVSTEIVACFSTKAATKPERNLQVSPASRRSWH